MSEPGVQSRTFDMWRPASSPITAVLQYISTLLWARNDRLMLLYRFMGCASLEEWYSGEPDVVRMLRRSLVTTSCWLHRRFAKRLAAYPWCLCAIGDTRASTDAKDAVWKSFLQMPVCCAPPGFARKLLISARAEGKIVEMCVITDVQVSFHFLFWAIYNF